MLDLFWRWLLVGALAFGGGQAALSLVERTAVTDAGWISAADFSTALAFSFVTPGPVLILATFIGYRVSGLAGAVAATVGVFFVPWFPATAAAHFLRHVVQHPWLRAFGRGAAPAVVALLVVNAFGLTRATYTGRFTQPSRSLRSCWASRARSTHSPSWRSGRWSERRARWGLKAREPGRSADWLSK